MGKLSYLKNGIRFSTLKAKILLSFAIILVLVLIYSTFNIINNIKINSATQQLIDEQLALQLANEASLASFSMEIASARGYVLTGESNNINEVDKYHEKLQENQKIIKAHSDNPLALDLIEMTNEWYTNIHSQVLDVYYAGDTELARKNLTTLEKSAATIRENYEVLVTDRSTEITKKAMI